MNTAQFITIFYSGSSAQEGQWESLDIVWELLDLDWNA